MLLHPIHGPGISQRSNTSSNLNGFTGRILAAGGSRLDFDRIWQTPVSIGKTFVDICFEVFWGLL